MCNQPATIISATEALQLAEKLRQERDKEAEAESIKLLKQIDKIIRSNCINCSVNTTVEIHHTGTADIITKTLTEAGYSITEFSHPRVMGPECDKWTLRFVWG